MTKENSKVFLLILLGMLTAFGPFVTDMYLPSLPSMGEYFHTTSSMVQLGLTTSMIGLAVGQIFFGPLSDRYGRRLPLLVAMWLFIVSTRAPIDVCALLPAEYRTNRHFQRLPFCCPLASFVRVQACENVYRWS